MTSSASNGPSFSKLGPFFAWDEDVTGPGWRSLADDLADAAYLDAWVVAQLERFAAGMGCDPSALDERAAASALHLGTCARILSPWLARIVMEADGGAVVPALTDLVWQPDGTTRFPLALVRPVPHTAEPARALVHQLAVPLGRGPLVDSESVAFGNVVSALNGAVVAMSRAWSGSAARVERAERLVDDVVTELAALRGRPEHTGALGHPTFHRRSCCLLYRLDGAGHLPTCGDCVLSR